MKASWLSTVGWGMFPFFIFLISCSEQRVPSRFIGLNVFYIVQDRPDQIRSMLFLVFFLSNKIRVFQLIFPDPMNVSYLIQMICYQSALCTSIVFYSNPRCYPHLWQNKKGDWPFHLRDCLENQCSISNFSNWFFCKQKVQTSYVPTHIIPCFLNI